MSSWVMTETAAAAVERFSGEPLTMLTGVSINSCSDSVNSTDAELVSWAGRLRAKIRLKTVTLTNRGSNLGRMGKKVNARQETARAGRRRIFSCRIGLPKLN